MIKAIVAVYSDWGIGAGGTQPVALKADRRRFREVTAGAAVIVGRKTLADFPGGRPLKNRANIVLTRRDLEIEGADVVHTPEEALEAAARHDRVFVVGGESVYKALFPYIDEIYVTKIDAAPRSDVFFPDLDADPSWRVVDSGAAMEEDGIAYRFLVYRRSPDL